MSGIRDLEVLGCCSVDFFRAADTVVEADAFVPDGIPDPISNSGNVTAPAVDEDEVEVRVGAEFTAPVAADGHEGHVLRVAAGCPIDEVCQPLVGGSGVGGAERIAVQARIGEEFVALEPERTLHSGTVAARFASTSVE